MSAGMSTTTVAIVRRPFLYTTTPILAWIGQAYVCYIATVNTWTGQNIDWATSWQNPQNVLCTLGTQISLGWPESSLCAQWVAKDRSFLHVDSEGSDQTGWMNRLIWVFAGRTAFCLFCGGSCIQNNMYSFFFQNNMYSFFSVSWVMRAFPWCKITFLSEDKILNKHAVVVLVFYGPSTLFRLFRVESVNLSTLFLGKTTRQFTST